MSSVKAVLACPSCSETTFGDTPAANAMVAAETMKGINDREVIALPHDQLRKVLRKYNRLVQ